MTLTISRTDQSNELKCLSKSTVGYDFAKLNARRVNLLIYMITLELRSKSLHLDSGQSGGKDFEIGVINSNIY